MKPSGTLPSDHLDARQFEVAVKRLANALAYGQESSPFLGSGIEYVQSRLYQPGDPVKFIDWRTTGRTGRFHVKEYEAPKQMPVYLLVDTSASMSISSLKMSKYAWAVQIAGGLALAAVEHMNPVGLMGVGERALHHTPALSRGIILQWLHQLRHLHFSEGTTLGKRVRELIPRVEQRCLFVVISDLHDPDALPAIKLMAQDHDCAVLHLEDPAERGALRAGILRGLEAESGKEFVARGGTRFLTEDTAGPLARAGVDYLKLPTDEPIVARLRHFLKNRTNSRRNG
ncbi:DUF58 domain-containing protein [Luteolibacter sp. LG18]|uniref:DUF58 domain-containing protein n=1 Tax=Luteolibacter sp. LG18 TaxID=2819286 RepID=UPI002B31AC28|nr:hypothetical protein llg_39190 [Luteolibacter sp. LG18]